MGALAGVALGDALGMPSQTLSRKEIAAAYGRIDDFVAPFEGHPVSDGLQAATVTDDTEQTLLLADHLIRTQGQFDEMAWAQALLDWEVSVQARRLHDLLGPSTKRALAALQDGAPASESGRTGTTNGAAMRVAPVGIATSADSAVHLARRVAEVSRVTHGSREAIAAASAVAAVVGMGIDGAEFSETLPQAFAACRVGADLGADVGEEDMASRIALALNAAHGGEERLAAEVGTSVASRESVAAAFGVASLADGDPWQAAVIAANLGDDTDTIGSIACAMAGACCGIEAFPADKLQRVMEVNRLDLRPVAEGLLALRDSQQTGAAT